jgi:hypothetical protein
VLGSGVLKTVLLCIVFCCELSSAIAVVAVTFVGAALCFVSRLFALGAVFVVLFVCLDARRVAVRGVCCCEQAVCGASESSPVLSSSASAVDLLSEACRSLVIISSSSLL